MIKTVGGRLDSGIGSVQDLITAVKTTEPTVYFWYIVYTVDVL